MARLHSYVIPFVLSLFSFLSLASFALHYHMPPVDISSNRTATSRAPVSAKHSYPVLHIQTMYIVNRLRVRENERARERRPRLEYYPFPLSNVTLFLSLSELDSAERTHSASTRRFALTPVNVVCERSIDGNQDILKSVFDV
ncbi:hypothetical protein BC827DRAFT_413531 [Russula dissimulans]|nr:hypothetical protein BC827DRAFT_413531 [Russula dissimulans]